MKTSELRSTVILLSLITSLAIIGFVDPASSYPRCSSPDDSDCPDPHKTGGYCRWDASCEPRVMSPGTCKYSNSEKMGNCDQYKCVGDTIKRNNGEICTSSGPECQYEDYKDCSNKNKCVGEPGNKRCENGDRVGNKDLQKYTCGGSSCKEGAKVEESSKCKVTIEENSGQCNPECECTGWKDKSCGGWAGSSSCKDTEMSQRKECTDKNGDYCGSGVSWRCVERTECGAEQDGNPGSGSGSETNDECDSNSDCSGGTSCSYGSQCDERASKKVPKCQNPSSNSSTCTTTTTTSGCPTRNTDPSADYSYGQNAENIDYDASPSSSNSGPSISSYSWTHGDGSSSGQTVSHEYGSRGNYDTTLTVSNACGSDSETKNYVWIDSRGTEMDETQISSPSDRWSLDKNTQSSDKCVFEGSLRSESTAIDIGKNNKDLEQGGHSLDKEACVSDSNSGAGGRWFDKDTEEATNLIGGRELNYYSGNWNTESLPAVEESGDTTGFDTPIWGPYTEGERDDDHDSSGNEPEDGESDKKDVKWNLWGIHNKVQDDSDQWDSGPDKYSSEPHPEKINKFAFTPDLTYSIDNTGKPYPPGSCYPRDQDSRLRTQVSDQSYTKEDKAFLIYGIASVWSETPSRALGILLLIPVAAFLGLAVLLASKIVTGKVIAVLRLGFGGLVAVALFAIGYLLRDDTTKTSDSESQAEPVA